MVGFSEVVAEDFFDRRPERVRLVEMAEPDGIVTEPDFKIGVARFSPLSNLIDIARTALMFLFSVKRRGEST
ncbi:MAG: hypothetical protein V4492_02215 [Chlamydiota bacterium]